LIVMTTLLLLLAPRREPAKRAQARRGHRKAGRKDAAPPSRKIMPHPCFFVISGDAVLCFNCISANDRQNDRPDAGFSRSFRLRAELATLRAIRAMTENKGDER
jgi:hypothetical protein